MSQQEQFRLTVVREYERKPGAYASDSLYAADAEEAERLAELALRQGDRVKHVVIYQRDANGHWQELTIARR